MAALVIAVDVTKDGVTNPKGVFSDIMDKRPTTVDRKPAEELIQKVLAAQHGLDWVEDADIRLREEGMPITGEAFVVPAGRSATTAQLREAVEAVHDVDWKMHDVVVTIVDAVDERRDPRAEDDALQR